MSDAAARLSHVLAGLAAAAHPALRAGCRAITAGDEHALTAAERAPMAQSAIAVRRASGAARILARSLLAQLGAPAAVELPRTASGAPYWPAGYVGSLAHDAAFAVAAVAPRCLLCSVGVDVEPAAPLPEEVLPLVATRAEQEQLKGDLLSARLLFCMKEAVYKATHPIDGVFLDFHDIEICLESSMARTISGRVLQIHTRYSPRLLAITVIIA